jgi:hypothetical protein
MAMRRRYSVFILALSLLSSGCNLVCDGIRTTCACFGDAVEDVREYRRDRALADEVWDNVCACKQGESYSVDYERGFRDGFVDYLYRGGCGDPPSLPPHRYRHFRYQTPDGYHAIEDWFAGYRHGATAARETNYRRWITGPAAPCGACGPGCGAAGCCAPGDAHPAAAGPYPVLSGKGPDTLPAASPSTPMMGAPVAVDAARGGTSEKTGVYPKTGIGFVPVDQ